MEVSRNIDSLLVLPELGDVLEVLGQLAVGGDDGTGNNLTHLFFLVILEWLQQQKRGYVVVVDIFVVVVIVFVYVVGVVTC